jgi:short-subunit dehydrogenase
LGPIIAMQAVIPVMRAQGGGSIVNINSGTAFMTIPPYSVYSSSKRALLGFSLAARAELEKDRIVVSEIYPFITATNFGKNRMGSPANRGPSADYARGDKPEFVAGLVLQAIEEGQAQYFANVAPARHTEGDTDKQASRYCGGGPAGFRFGTIINTKTLATSVSLRFVRLRCSCIAGSYQ